MGNQFKSTRGFSFMYLFLSAVELLYFKSLTEVIQASKLAINI